MPPRIPRKPAGRGERQLEPLSWEQKLGQAAGRASMGSGTQDYPQMVSGPGVI